MENVLIYTRVKSQNSRLQKKLQEKAYTYCKENDFNVIKVVNEIGHNKNLNRFCWRKTMHFINTNPGKIQYIVVNKYLVEDLVKLGLWSKDLKDTIIANDGSIQNIDIIPNDLKALYKTVWEISMKSVIEQCRDRGVFVDQMQSMNLFMANPNYKRLTSMHFYAWKANLKSGMYYLRSKSSASAGKFSIDPELEQRIKEKQQRGIELKKEEEEAVLACSLANREACEMCSS